MNEVLELQYPFYLPEVVNRLVRPVIADLAGSKFPAAALEDPACCEALNQALKASIEAAQ